LRNKFLLAILIAATAQAQANPWPQMAKSDLDFVYKTLQENHPGAIDKENPAFKQWLERGYAAASASSANAASLPDMKRLLSRYLAGFADGHLVVGFNQQATHVKWPGFIMGRIGTRYQVTGQGGDWKGPRPALGAELISCDGRAPDTMMNEDILPVLFNLTTLNSVKNRHMFHMFLDDDLVPHQYARCIFEQAGARKQFALDWQRLRQSSYEQYWEAANPRASKHSTITRLAPKRYWVHLPDFHPDAAGETELKKVIADMPSLRAAELVVFDLRGNNGGNSQWADDTLAGLYGKEFIDHRKALQDSKSYTEWRVSEDNLKHIDGIVAEASRQFGATSDNAIEFAGLATRMRSALKAGQPFVRQSTSLPPAPARIAPLPLSKARAILVTDSSCASSCLNGADVVLSLPDVRHFGHTTGADTVFMDVRKVDLPSGLGVLVLAQKVDRAGLRGNNQPWVPSLQYDGQIGDTEKVKAWVLKNAH
jgi:hypothetical protein